VPAEITIKLIIQAMRENGWNQKKYLIDGFPRNFENYQNWLKSTEGTVVVKQVLQFCCSEVYYLIYVKLIGIEHKI
jgi:hypothetical protein